MHSRISTQDSCQELRNRDIVQNYSTFLLVIFRHFEVKDGKLDEGPEGIRTVA